MVVELIFVGTELLLGDIVNTNAAFLSGKCALCGLSCFHQQVVGDNITRLLEVIKVAKERADIIIFSGGLGPTKDDLTKDAVAKAFRREFVEDLHSRERIKTYFQKMGRTVTENNWQQALIPKGAKVIDNQNGTAPGIIIEDTDCTAILLPGPPGELIPMFEDKVMPYLKQFASEGIYSQVVKLCGIGESFAETKVKDLIAKQSNPTIAPYAKIGEVHFRITAKAKDQKEAVALMKPVTEELKNRFGEAIFTFNEKETLEECLINTLAQQNLTLTTAESCTGGLLSGRIINVAGASSVYNEGYITYSNQAKMKLLGVSSDTLKKYGAVSEQTAKEMAKGASRAANADVALSVTGIAGPEGGTKEKPVGLVYIGCYMKDELKVRKCLFSGDRQKNRELAVANALALLREML